MNNSIKVEPLNWFVTEMEKVEIEVTETDPNPSENYGLTVPLSEGTSIVGLRSKQTGPWLMADMMTADDLPVEFFNHQLLDYQYNDFDALKEFTETWGILYSPQRNAKFCLAPWNIVWHYAETGIAETWHLEEALTETDMNTEDRLIEMIESGEATTENLVFKVAELNEMPCADTIGRVVSFMEVSTTLYVLQETVRTLREIEGTGGWSSDDLDRVIGVLNAGACNERVVIPSVDWYYSTLSNLNTQLSSRGNLTSAICNQIIDCIADEAPWRQCACEGCGRLFKRKQSSSPNPDSDSKYCCDKCMERQKKRNQRAAAKNRIKH